MTHVLTCDQCWCYVCDVPVDKCHSWNEDHCHACEETLWIQKRKEKKNAHKNNRGASGTAAAAGETHSNIVDLCRSDSSEHDEDGNDSADSGVNFADMHHAQSAFMQFLQSRGVTHNGAPITSATGKSRRTQRLDLEQLDERMYGHHFDTRRRKQDDDDADLVGNRPRKDVKIVDGTDFLQQLTTTMIRKPLGAVSNLLIFVLILILSITA